MIVHLRMPDEVYEGYAKFSSSVAARGGNGGASPEDLMTAQLGRFAQVPPMDRVIVVSSGIRSELERILSGGTLRDDADLLQKVQRLSDVAIQGVRLNFTPAQLSQIRIHATKNSLSEEECVKRIVRQMEFMFFDFISE